MIRGVWIRVCVGTAVCLAGTGQAAEKIDFVRQIRPIFEQRCVECHGPDKQKSDLRLDSHRAVLAGADGEPVVVAGKPDDSPLYFRISLPAGDIEIMPPEGDPLTKAQIALIRDWIAQGAERGEGPQVVQPDADKPGPASAADAAEKPPSSQPAAPDLLSTIKAPPPDADALAALRQAGVLALPVGGGSTLLSVSFLNAPDVRSADAPWRHIKTLAEQITWLDLGRTNMTDKEMAHLADLKHLTRLHLERTAVSDAGLAHLKDAKLLQYLNLYGTAVTDAGLKHLESLENLRRLYLWQTKVTAEGARALKGRFPGLETSLGWEPDKDESIAEPKAAQAEASPAGKPDEKTAEKPAANPAEAPPAAQAAGKPINTTCPLSGQPVNAAFTFAYKGKSIGFCCGNCLEKFAAEPEQFIAKVKEF